MRLAFHLAIWTPFDICQSLNIEYRRRRRFLNVVCNRHKTISEVVLNFTNYVIGISSGHLVFVEVWIQYYVIFILNCTRLSKKTLLNNNVLASYKSSLRCRILNIYCCFIQTSRLVHLNKSKQIFDILDWTRPNWRATKIFLLKKSFLTSVVFYAQKRTQEGRIISPEAIFRKSNATSNGNWSQCVRFRAFLHSISNGNLHTRWQKRDFLLLIFLSDPEKMSFWSHCPYH